MTYMRFIAGVCAIVMLAVCASACEIKITTDDNTKKLIESIAQSAMESDRNVESETQVESIKAESQSDTKVSSEDNTVTSSEDTYVSSSSEQTSSTARPPRQPVAVVDSAATNGRFDINLSGKTVRLLTWYTPESWEQNIYDDFEKQTAADIEYITVADSTMMFQKLTALIASNDAPDATAMNGSDFPGFVTKKLAQPITKYIDKSKDTWLAYELMDTMKYDGEYYGLTDHFWGHATFVYFNKKIFSSSTKVNKTPLDYYKEGNWTWDTFYELAKKLTVIQGGTVTQYGAKMEDQAAFARSAGASIVKAQNGTFSNTINSKEMKDAFTLLKKMYADKCITKNEGTWTGGNVAMQVFDQWPIRVDNYNSWKSANFQWDWVPFPSYTGGTSYQPTSLQVGIVPQNADNPELGFALINFRAYYQENMKGTSQSNKEWLERWKKAVTGNTCSSLEVGILGDQIYNLYKELADPNIPLQTTIDSWKPVVDGRIKNYEKDKAALKIQ